MLSTFEVLTKVRYINSLLLLLLKVKCETVINSKILLCFIMLILLIFHAISGLGKTGVNFIASMI